MNRILMLVLVLPVLGFSQQISSGLIGYWPLDGNTVDESTNNVSSTFYGGNLNNAEGHNLKANKAVDFDGVDDVIQIEDHDRYTFSENGVDKPFSISLWIKPNSVNMDGGSSPQTHAIFSKVNYGTASAEYAIVLFANGVLQGRIDDRVSNSTTGKVGYVRTYANIIKPNLWQHIVMVYDGSGNPLNIKLYVNGVEAVLNPGDSYNNDGYQSMKNTNAVIGIGGRVGSPYQFAGAMDEVYLFNKVLSQSEINLLYQDPEPSNSFTNLHEDSDGDIGIGVNPPSSRLHIIGEDPVLTLEDNIDSYIPSQYGPQGDFGSVEMNFKQGRNGVVNKNFSIGLIHAPSTTSNGFFIRNNNNLEGIYIYDSSDKMFFGGTDLVDTYVHTDYKFIFDDKGYFPELKLGNGLQIGAATPNAENNILAGTIEFKNGQFWVYNIDNQPVELGGGGLSEGLEHNEARNQLVINANEVYPGGTHIQGKVAIGEVYNTIGQHKGIPEDYHLAVAGNIIAQKIKVAILGEEEWQDKVFAKDYPLLSLDSVQTYITENSHLPGVPSAEDVVTNGVEITEITSTLLGKIEELTLYVLQQKKENELLRLEMEEIKTLLQSK